MKSYEQLLGAEGRRVFFRAERFKAKELLSPKLVSLDVDDIPLRLIDFSLSGVAAVDAPAADWSERVGETVTVRIGVGRETAHQGRGHICRVETTTMGPKLGIRFVEGYLDVGELMARHEEVALRQELDGSLEAEIDSICPGYRLLCADVLYFLRRYKTTLERVAETAQPVIGRRNRHRLDELLDYCEEKAIPDWRRLWARGDELVASIMGDPEKLRAVKRFTELVVTPEFMAAPIWQRSYEKPLGYPGDFQVMRQVYDWQRIGDTAYGRLVHRLGLDVAECIATRMVAIKQTIAETVAAAPDDGERVNILSLGCGPAQEVANYLHVPKLPHPVSFTLIDQDETALSFAYEQTLPEVARFNGQAAVSCLHVSFTQLLKAWSVLGELPKQDLIYSVGLIDYLALRRARTLITTLYEQLKPGGQLVIGNMRETAMSNLWPMEFICDWTVIYRDEADMRALVEGLSPAPVIEAVTPDRTGRVYLLYARKPA